MERVYNLEDRLVKFAIMMLNVCDLLPFTKTGSNLAHQLSKSGTAPALKGKASCCTWKYRSCIKRM